MKATSKMEIPFTIVKSARNKFYLLISLFSFFLFFYSCIEPFSPDLAKSDLESKLVVEGRITDEPGPFRVRLTKSGSVYSNVLVYISEPVSGADVHITDDKGNDFKLYQSVNGWYETLDTCLQGIPGNIYTLHITGEDGNQFESTPELMMEVPPIDSLFYEEEQRTFIEGDKVIQEGWLDILLNTQTPDDGIHYLKWEFEETWEFKMPSYVLVDHGFNEGYANPSTMETINIADEKILCWVTEPSAKIHVKSTVSHQDNKIENYLLQSISSSGDKINIKYSILVKQYSINKELYNYFKKLVEANIETEGLYSKMPGEVFGNISCSNNGEKALGLFFASSVSLKRIFINHEDTNLEKGTAYNSCGWTTAPPPMIVYLYGTYEDKDGNMIKVWSGDFYCTDCRKRGTSVKPDFW